MNQSDDRPRPIHPQNSYKGLEGLMRLSQRLGCHNAPHEQEELEPSIANAGTRGSHTRTQVHNASHGQSSRAPAPTEPAAASNVEQRNAFFQNAHGFNISGNPSFQNQNIGSITNNYGGGTDITRQLEGLEKMEKFVLFDAQFDSAAQDPNCQCYPGTRQNVLKMLGNWIDNPNSAERISWLHGPAGAGKSAIARTIARSYARSYAQSNLPKVAATFFFRSDVNRSNTNRLITTLAYQLALSMPDIRDFIATSLCEHPDLPTKDVETQFNHFLAQPFHVLREDAAQQLAPAASRITNIVDKFQQLAPIIVIDGVDECTDENLQRRFLEIIGDAVRNDRFPLRFLIVSRSERHIERATDRFQRPILGIDLAKLDDADQDIDKYLTEQFSHIASEQDLDPTWPGVEVIDSIKRKSSGNFIFPSLVIKCVSDLDNTAENLLEIVLSNKSASTSTSTAFAELDKLFFETLGRVPEQDFLKKYLVLLVARISISNHYIELYKDDAILMHISEKELHAKLRRLCSLLKFKPEIDVHHLSFLDFLHDSSRSRQYYIPAQGGIKRYLNEFVNSFVQYISTVIEKSDHYNNGLHFKPSFRAMIEVFPPKIKLPVNEWQKVTQPLLDLQDKLLQSPTTTWDILRCKNCAVFHVLRELLYLGQQLENLRGKPNTTSVGGVESVRNVRKRRSVVSLITSKTEKNMDGDLDSVLLPLFDQLREAKGDCSSNEIVSHVNVILLVGFDPDYATTAARVRFASDAQKLVDVLIHLIEKNELSPDATYKATLLVLELCARVPILPLSSFSNGSNNLCPHPSLHVNIPMQVLSQTIIASRVLDRRYVVPVLVSEGKNSVTLVSGDADYNDLSMKEGRKKIITRSGIVKQIMLGVAKAIQYLHSMGVVLHREFGSRDIFFKLEKGLPSGPKIRCLCSISQFPLEERWKEWFSREENIFSFGCIFYELFTGVDTKPPISRRNIPKGPSVLEIPGDEWQLIQQCCAEDAESRPTMDSIVQKMETWK